MKKRIILTLAAMTLVSLGLAACTPSTPEEEPPVEEEEKTYDVTFVDGETVLHKETVKEGETVDEWDPTTEVTDKTFLGWFGEPTLTHEFDFTTAITKDTTIFGSFTEFTEDTRTWVVAGSGTSSILKSSNWGQVVEEKHKMTKLDKAGENVYQFTMDLFVNDQFQFMVPEYSEDGKIAWGAQRGGGYLQEPTRDGVEYFSAGGGLGGNTQKTNMTTLVAGNYTFELHTFPDGDAFFDDETDNPNQNYSNYDFITWKRNGDTIETQAKVETTYYIKGAQISAWKDMINPYTTMTPNDDRTVHTLSIYLKEGDEVMFASSFKDATTQEVSVGNKFIKANNLDEASKTYLSGDASNMTTLVSGLYEFTFDEPTTTLSVTVDEDYVVPEMDYYVNGNFDNDPSWANKVGHDEYKLVKEGETSVYKVSGLNLKKGEQLGIQETEKDNSEERTNFYAYTYLMPGTTGFVKAESGSNIVCDADGVYDLSLDTYSMIITLTPSEA